MNWQQYINNYPDLQLIGIDSEAKAIKHYNKFGKKENRTDKLNSTINNTCINLGGRFGNILFYNLVADYIARKINLNFTYKNNDEIKQLGIELYKGTETYNETISITDENVDELFKENALIKKSNILIGGYFQTPTIAKYIRNHIINSKENIIKSNPYHYSNNNLFIHIRLGDIIQFNGQESLSYYEGCISKIQFDKGFDKGFISSDNIKHEYCLHLIKKYNLTVFEGNEVQTMQFGSTCNHIVLSKGTFSWLIGVLSFNANVYYPENKNIKPWHGEIFVFPEWNKVVY
jgi:hypothetical protein